MITNLMLLRGGSWSLNQDLARAVYRNDFYPDYRGNNFGFRVVGCGGPEIPLVSVRRGGSWYLDGFYCRSFVRFAYRAGDHLSYTGFRVTTLKEDI